jgi:hypothetical protein
MIHRPEEQLMPLVRSAVLLILLLTAGCAGMDRASQGEPPKTGAMQEKAPGLEPQQAAAKQETAVAAKPAQTAPKQSGPVAVEPAPTPAAPPAAASPSQSAAKPEAAAAKLPAQAPAPPAPKEPAPKKESAAPLAPPLDLASLETRLKETNAIGVFTKLTLKNQVDALLDRFREYYQGRIKTTLAQLRQPYDQLLLKVLSLLQDSDPPLARAIAQSREAIWGILSDPDKFKNL